MRFETFLGAVSGLLVFASAAIAAYSDPSILTIEGDQRTVSDRYPIERLRSDFDNVEIETRTPWTKKGETIKFRGPRIADVLLRQGMGSAKSVQFIGYDNFTSEILLKEIQSYLRRGNQRESAASIRMRMPADWNAGRA